MGLLDSIFGGGGGGGTAQAIDPKATRETRQKLLDLITEGPEALVSRGELARPPAIPAAPTVPLTPFEQRAQELLGQWAGRREPETRALARKTATEAITQPVDITQLPEYQGILQDVGEQGNLLVNRLSRGLQKVGALVSTGGRDILGRAVTGIQKSLAGALAPFAMEERARKFGMIPVLEEFARTEERQPLETIQGLRTYDLTRMLEEQKAQAEYQRQVSEMGFPYQVQAPMLTGILGGQQPGIAITGGQPSTFSQIAPLIGPLLTGIMGRGGEGGGGLDFSSLLGFRLPAGQAGPTTSGLLGSLLGF